MATSLEISEQTYGRIEKLALVIKRDIDLAAGPNPIDPRMARAKQNALRLVEALKKIEIVPEIAARSPASSPMMSEEEITEQEAQFPESDTAGL
jgi:hypothetical protein